jgi:predicted Zn-ribbon and HTH transcriptional regulator
MIDFNVEGDWQRVKKDIMNHIPTIPTGIGKYNEWIARIGNFRQAGYELEEVQAWCGADGDLTEDKFNQAPGSESELEARKILFSIAQKNGYVCNHEGTPQTVQRYKMPNDEASTDDAINNTIKLFNSMYSPEDVVYICNGRHSPQQNKIVPDGGSIVGVKVNTFTPEVLRGFLQFDKGMYIQYNQVDEVAFNQYKQTKKNGSIKNEHIQSFKYAYIEADPPEGVEFREFFNDSVKKLESMDLPWLAHVFSGNKSIHTIVRIDANTKEEYKERLKFIHNYCKKCGYEIDDAVKNTARWGRFPCCKRGNSYQYIMEYNPAPCSYDEWAKRHTPPPNPLLDAKGNVDSASMLEFINQLGFASCIDGDDAVLVQIEGKMVEKIKTKKMIGIVNEAIKASDPLILSKTQTFLGGKSANYFANLPFVDITNHTDSSESVYLYFKNCFVEITKNEVIQHDYSDMQGFLWKGQIPSMKRDYTADDDQVKSIYEKFIHNITSNKTDSGFVQNHEAKKSAETIIGYLMSRNKKASEAKAVLLTEKGAGAIEADAVGGTGKGIFIQALEQFRVDGEIDGKDLRSEDRFAFSAY